MGIGWAAVAVAAVQVGLNAVQLAAKLLADDPAQTIRLVITH